ncbi:MAG: hypothetical protein ACRCSV_01170 [Chlamydiales bacterium]
MNRMQIDIDKRMKVLIQINDERLMEAGIKKRKVTKKKKSLAATRLLTPKNRGKRLCIQL